MSLTNGVSPPPRHPPTPPGGQDTDLRHLQALAVQIADRLEHQRKDIDRVSDVVDMVQEGMQVFRDFMMETRSRTEMLSDLSEDAELLTSNMAKVWRKANEIEGLVLQVEMMKHRIRRLEDSARVLTPVLGPAGADGPDAHRPHPDAARPPPPHPRRAVSAGQSGPPGGWEGGHGPEESGGPPPHKRKADVELPHARPRDEYDDPALHKRSRVSGEGEPMHHRHLMDLDEMPRDPRDEMRSSSNGYYAMPKGTYPDLPALRYEEAMEEEYRLHGQISPGRTPLTPRSRGRGRPRGVTRGGSTHGHRGMPGEGVRMAEWEHAPPMDVDLTRRSPHMMPPHDPHLIRRGYGAAAYPTPPHHHAQPAHPRRNELGQLLKKNGEPDQRAATIRRRAAEMRARKAALESQQAEAAQAPVSHPTPPEPKEPASAPPAPASEGSMNNDTEKEAEPHREREREREHEREPPATETVEREGHVEAA
ncbi:MAG: hypothetical protein M1838_001865 [Thelocarpon superellum]|nr:MAG: hypothetical protein M1838_001865 [Thelocarpon superellum]